MSHRARVPAPVAAYFGIYTDPAFVDHPIITGVYRSGHGWKRYPLRKRVSTTWLRKMRREEGATGVALTCHGRTADFTTDELLGRPRR